MTIVPAQPLDDARVPLPGTEWVALVDSDPIRALAAFVLGWYPAPDGEEDQEDVWGGAESPDDGSGGMPEALGALYRLTRLRPALHGFHAPLERLPRRAAGPLGERLVFAGDSQSSWDWSVPWPADGTHEADPAVWMTFDPHRPTADTDAEVVVEREPLSRFLLQYVLYQTQQAAPFKAWTKVMPTSRLAPLRDVLRPVPLSPFLPMFTSESIYVAPGLLALINADGDEAVAAFGTLDRQTLMPLGEYPFPWSWFDA
ncbi:hypothetical protein [Streptomyces sp. NPDC020917]|uniref:hypothetical protein n=1 Tax=Streptomyces sp. NPDC020917 TaxID=3365102 RepID=UPI0037AAEB96